MRLFSAIFLGGIGGVGGPKKTRIVFFFFFFFLKNFNVRFLYIRNQALIALVYILRHASGRSTNGGLWIEDRTPKENF